MTKEQTRSTFVTVVAWIFIALSGFCTAISILQNIMVFTVFSRPEVNQTLAVSAAMGMPSLFSFFANHFQLFFLAFLLVSVFTLATSIGLLKRRNWARLCFAGIMILAIAWQVFGIILQFSMISSMRGPFSSAAMSGGPNMQSFIIAAAVFGVIFALGICVLFGWLAKRLLSPLVSAEFCR